MTNMTMTDEERELIARMVQEVRAKFPVRVELSALDAIRIAGLLQLADRHPQISPDNHGAIRWFVDYLREYFHDCPAVLEVLRRGDRRMNDG